MKKRKYMWYIIVFLPRRLFYTYDNPAKFLVDRIQNTFRKKIISINNFDQDNGGEINFVIRAGIKGFMRRLGKLAKILTEEEFLLVSIRGPFEDTEEVKTHDSI